MNHKPNFAPRIPNRIACFLALAFFPLWIDASNQQLDSLRLALQNAEESEKAYIYHNISRLHLGSSYDSTYHYAILMEKHARRNAQDSLLAFALLQQGSALLNMGRFKESLNLLQNGLEVAHQFPHSHVSGSLTYTIGVVHLRMNDYERGVAYVRKALPIFERLDFTAGKINVLNGIGGYHIFQKRYDSAIIYFERAIEIIPPDYHVSFYGNAKGNIANCYTEMRRYDLALETLYTLLEMWQQASHIRGQMSTLGNISQILIETGKGDEAIPLLEKAYQLSQAHNIDFMVPYIIKHLSLAKEDMGQYKQALQYHKQYAEMNDSLHQADYLQQMADMEIKYQTAEKQRENEGLKVELLSNQLKTSRRESVIRGMVFGSIMLLIIILLLLQLLKSRSKTFAQQRLVQNLKIAQTEQEKQEIEQRLAYEKQVSLLERKAHQNEIDLKNRELVSATMQILNRNRILEEVRHLADTTSTEMFKQNIDEKLSSQVRMEKDWEHFKQHFQQVHPSFFEKLREIHPQLTDHELRLAAFLRTNLSTKEMSQLLHVTTAAINKSRQRLRKKLGIAPDESLYAFMNQN